MLLLISFLLFTFYFSSSLLSLYTSSSFSLTCIFSSSLCPIHHYSISNPFYLTLFIPICFCILSSSSSFSSSHITSTCFASVYLPLLHFFTLSFSSSISYLPLFILFIPTFFSSFLSYLHLLYISPPTCSSSFSSIFSPLSLPLYLTSSLSIHLNFLLFFSFLFSIFLSSSNSLSLL
ncbi:unnamed protein product [Acanthosepion pharaonis]|uniref:Uncharacterized protein n=1 Tax=Acanthosepion pharaonis TaxID=158019 RepID=A0A812BDU3_ACAPH|nr:unnamed protein product [Sepia pharaonis]